MPVNAAELMVKIGADTADLKTGMAEADGAVNKFGATASTVGKVGMVALGGGILAVAGGLGSSAKVAGDFEQSLSGIQAVSGATSAQMEDIANKALDIGKNTSFSASEGADAIGELAKAGISIPDIMNGAADATVALAAASGVTVPEAATLASNALNQFHLAAKDLPSVVDLMAGAANASAIDMKDFGYSMSAVGAVANLAGLDFKATAVAIAEMGNAGIKGSDAGTSLKSFLQSLTPNSNTATAAMKELGLITKDGANQFYDAQGKLKSLADIQQLLQDSTKNLTQEQKSMYLSTIFGSDGIRAAAVMADQGKKGFDDLAESMTKVSASDVASTRMNNTKGSMEALKGSIETLQIVIGRALLPGIKSSIDMFTGFLNVLIPLAQRYFPMLVAAIQPVRDAITGFIQAGIAAAMPLLTRFGQWFMTDGIEALRRFNGMIQDTFQRALPFIQQFARSFVDNVIPALLQLGQAGGTALQRILPIVRDQLLPAFAQFGQFLVTQVIPALARLASFVLSDVVPVIVDLYSRYIVALVAGLTTFATFIQTQVIPVIQQMAQWFSVNILPALQQFAGFVTGTIIPAVTAFASFLSANLGPAIQAIGGWFTANVLPALQQFGGFLSSTVLPLLQSFADFVTQVVVPAIVAIVQVIADNWPRIQTIITSVMDVVVAVVQDAWDVISTVIDDALNVIRGILDVFVGVFTGDWGRAWDGVKTILSSVWDAIQVIVSNAMDLIGTTIRAALDIVSTIFQAGWDAVKAIADTVWGLIEDGIRGYIGNVRDNIKTVLDFIHDSIWEPIWRKVSTTVGTIWDGIKLAVQTAIESVRDTVKTVTDFIHDSIIEPIWTKIQATTEALWSGATSVVSSVKGGLETLKTDLTTAMNFIHDSIIEPIWTKVQKLFTDSKQTIHDAIMWPFEQARDAITGVMNAFKGNLATPWNAAANGINGFISGMAGAINWVAGKLNLGNVIDMGGIVKVPTFARGGTTPGGPIIAGEEGPELLLPPGGMSVLTANQTREMYRNLHGAYPTGNLDVGKPPGVIGLGGPWDWAKDKVKGVEEAIASTIRDFVAKGAKAMLETAMNAVGVANPGGGGVLGQIGAGIVPMVKDVAIQGIQGLFDAIKDVIPKPPTGGGGTPDGGLVQGNTILDAAHRHFRAYGECEGFVGDVLQGLGLNYFRAFDAKSHAHMQGLNPGIGPDGSVVFWDFPPNGHVAFSERGGFYGTLPGRPGWSPGGAYGQPAGWTTNPAYNGAVFNEPMVGLGASGQRWTMAENDAEILLNRGQASRAADALRGRGDVIFQAGAIVIQTPSLKDVTDEDLAAFMRRAGRVAKRDMVSSGGSTI